MDNQTQETPINYCLYARKSSESDERQAMSIGSQIKEMKDLAKRDKLNIIDVYQESHSAKISNTRPIFGKLLTDIVQGKFNGILAWAPDRLSRNAGDLGMLVDMMDQGKLLKIKTYSQTFSNNPNEKFLLMILCSQAKLENDQKGENVKRGIRAKCEQGWRPGMAPLGYFNRAHAGTKDIIIDPKQGPLVKEAFEKVAFQNWSGRKLKEWFDKVGFANRSGKLATLSQIYLMLKKPFYYGRFEYPEGSGNWYQGAHEPLITKKLFDKVQEKLVVPKKSKWGSRNVLFRDVFKCASCGATITGEEKFRKRKQGNPRRHVYYQCAKARNKKCKEVMLSEKQLIGALTRYVNFMSLHHPQKIKLTHKVKTGMETYRKIREQVLLLKDINPGSEEISFTEYAKYVLRDGSNEEKREIVKVFGKYLYIHDKEVCSAPIS
ncbi:MAG: recombinase family protein [Candidatus Pacebacteria bacterium]|nr:recombinase family protein [Candidatus Paceibacterota bacterium]